MADISATSGYYVQTGTGTATRYFWNGTSWVKITGSESAYEPMCYNDNGVYSYFYIDFKKAMSDFSLGMLQESILVWTDEKLTITNLENISSGVYRIYCDISSGKLGVSVVGISDSLLSDANGIKLEPFSTMFYVEGMDEYKRLGYFYDHVNTSEIFSIFENKTESIPSFSFSSSTVVIGTISENNTFTALNKFTETENVSVILTTK